MDTQNINVVPVMPTFLQESGLAVFTALSSPEFTIQVPSTAQYKTKHQFFYLIFISYILHGNRETTPRC